MNMNLQYFGGRGSGGGKSGGGGGSASGGGRGSKFSNMSESQAEKEIDSQNFEKVRGGAYWSLDTQDSELGEISIERTTNGSYIVSQNIGGESIDSFVTEGSINSVKGEAKEFLKGKWRSIYG